MKCPRGPPLNLSGGEEAGDKSPGGKKWREGAEDVLDGLNAGVEYEASGRKKVVRVSV